MKGHVTSVRLTCSKDKSHSYLWSSSPYLPTDEYLVNHRLSHAFFSSGILPVHYTRFAKADGIGCITKEKRSRIFRNYKDHAERESEDSIQVAINEEIASYEELDGINIMTDARHGWRKNSKDTSVVALGEKTHKVMDCVHVTKTRDPVTQRHERIGTETIYEHLAEKDVSVKIHAHDRNLSINKFIKDTHFTTNQNDLWHAVKAIKKAITNVSKGPKDSHGITWSEQLTDKMEPIATHINWAIRNCNENPQQLKKYLENIVEHYSNNHTKCHPTSRCKTDKNCEPSRIVIICSKAKKLLDSVIRRSTIYKAPGDYVSAKVTFYVESFNNVINIFQDKRISFSGEQYKFRLNLAVLHWNENVDRKYTSIWKSRNSNVSPPPPPPPPHKEERKCTKN